MAGASSVLEILVRARDEASGVLRRVEGATSSLARGASGVSSAWGRVSPVLGGVARGVAAATAAVGAGAVALTGVGLRTAASMEQARIGFETMLGSARRADAFLEDLAEFAAKTPFEFPDLVSASQRLLALGFAAQDVRPMMTAIGNAVAAVGGGAAEIDRAVTAIGQIQAKGRLQAEEMLQLNELGIFSWQMLADAIGTSVPKAMERVRKGQVSAAQFMQAFQQQTGEAFGNMMRRQSQSLLGMLSTFRDAVTMRLADTASPLVEALKQALPQVTSLVGRLLDEVGPIFADLVGMIARAAQALLPLVAPVARVLAEVLASAVRALVPVLSALAPIVTELAVALGEVLVALLPLIPPLGELLVAATPLLVVLAELLAAVLRPMVGVARVLVGALAALVRPIVGVAQAVAQAIEAGRAWSAAWQALRAAAQAALGAIRSAASRTLGWLRGAFRAVAEVGRGIWEQILGAARAAFNAVALAWNSTVGRLSFRVPGWVPLIGGRGFDVPDIPLLAAGGIVTRPLIAGLGEAGPEAVIPLRRGMAPLRIDVRLVVDRRRFVGASDVEFIWGGRW